jgi:hypothetical protein
MFGLDASGTFFQAPPPLILDLLRQRLRACPRTLTNALAVENEVQSPHFASFVSV